MFRKTRIRSLIAISALTGATVLGGAGLAGATGGSDADATVEDTLVTEQQDLLASATSQMSTGEAEVSALELPEAPELPEQAADRARQALDERGPERDATTETGAEETTSDETTTDQDGTGDVERDGPPADTHGAAVSEAARDGEPGPGHGESVSEVARQQGEERRQAADEDRSERGGQQETTEDEGNEDLEQ